jgi:hypothetical protein
VDVVDSEQREADEAAEGEADRQREDHRPAVVDPSGEQADGLAEALADVVVERAGGVDPLRIARDDPGQPEHADGCQQDRDRGGDAGALACEAESGDRRC